jgi:zinc transporter ZupT
VIIEEQEPILTVLLYTSIAAGAAATAAIPMALQKRVPLGGLAAAYAVATGMMLGIGYILMEVGLSRSTLPLVAGACVGALYTWWTHRYTDPQEVDALPVDDIGQLAGYRLILVHTIHSGSEGVALGVAMALNLRLGAFLALAMALHNICEALALAGVLEKRGLGAGETARLCVITNVPQILLAVLAFAIAPTVAGLLPWLLGFAAGTLVFLTMTELLPSAYRRADRGWIAALVSGAAGAVVLVKAFVV